MAEYLAGIRTARMTMTADYDDRPNFDNSDDEPPPEEIGDGTEGGGDGRDRKRQRLESQCARFS